MSNIPATLTRGRLTLGRVVGNEVEVEEGNANAQPKTSEEITGLQTITTEAPYEQNDEEHNEHDGDPRNEEMEGSRETSSTVAMCHQQSLLASFFDTSLLQGRTITRTMSGLPDILPTASYNTPLEITHGIRPDRAILSDPNGTASTSTTHIQRLDAETGALVLYRPRRFRRTSRQLQQAVEELSDCLEPFQNWSFEQSLLPGHLTTQIPNPSCVVSPNETSQTLNLQEELADRNDSKVSDISVYTTACVDQRSVSVLLSDTSVPGDWHQEILRLNAGHRVEIAKVKNSNRENLQVCASDLDEQKKKAERAMQRAARSLRQLKASRDERQALGERLQPLEVLHARITELEVQSAKKDVDIDYLLEEGTKLQNSLGDAHVNFEALQRNRDTIWNGYQTLQQHSDRQKDLLEDLRDDLKALRHQMNLAVGEKADALAGQAHLGQKIEKLQLINRALLNKRGDIYAEIPFGTEQPGQLRPDQLRDAEKALLTSQSEHKKANEYALALLSKLNTTSDALEEVTGQVKVLKCENTELKYALARIANLERANQEMIQLMGNPCLNGPDEELFNASIRAQNEKNGLTKLIRHGVWKNAKLQQSLEQKHWEGDIVVEEYEQKIQQIEKENDTLQDENLGRAIEIRDLTKIAVLYRHARKDNSILLEDVNALRAQLATRAFGRDETFLWNDANRQLANAMVQIQQLEDVVYDQQLILQHKDADAALSENLQKQRFEYPLSLLLARDRYYAVVQAFLQRFQNQLSMEGPLVVDVTGCLLLLNDDEIQEFMQFPEHLIQSGHLDLGDEVIELASDRIWMRVVYDEERVKGVSQADDIDPEALEHMMSAVEAEALQTRRSDLDEARAAQEAEQERRKRDEEFWEVFKQEQNTAYDQDREKVRQEATKDKLEVAAVLDKVRQRSDWESINPLLADAENEDWETVNNCSS